MWWRKKKKHVFPEPTDALKDADTVTRVRYVLDLWKEKSNGRFRYDCDSHGVFSFPFRAAMINISLHEIPRHALCRVFPQSPLPPLIVKYPFDEICLEKSTEWFHNRIYSNLEILPTPPEQDKNQNAVAITTRACLSEHHIIPASVLHTLTEIADGYWQLAKALFQSGLLNETLSRFSPEGRLRIESILNRLEDVKTGVLTGKLAKQMLPNDFPSLLKKETVPLPFHNLIGDKPGSSMAQLEEYMRTYAPEVLSPGHFDAYSIQSRYLKDFILSLTQFLEDAGRDFQLETIHQGFPRLPRFWDRKIFLAVRYAVKLADPRSIDAKKLQEWRESLLFTNKPRIPTQYNITSESVELLITLPFSLVENANYPYPEFFVDNQTYDLNNLTQNLKDFSFNVEGEIRQMRERVQMLK